MTYELTSCFRYINESIELVCCKYSNDLFILAFDGNELCLPKYPYYWLLSFADESENIQEDELDGTTW